MCQIPMCTDVSDSNQNVETTCHSKLKFTELKVLFIKEVQKTSQRWIMDIANTGILKLRISSFMGFCFK